MTRYKVKIEVIDILNDGKCSMGQEIGTVYNYPEDRGKMCPSSFYVLYPWIMVMLYGGNIAEDDEKSDSMTTGCPDHKHQVVYKISRTALEN